MGQRGSPAIPKLQQPTGEVKTAATELTDGANSRLSDITGPGETEGNYILEPHISFPTEPDT